MEIQKFSIRRKRHENKNTVNFAGLCCGADIPRMFYE
jgi:hypothetical protein